MRLASVTDDQRSWVGCVDSAGSSIREVRVPVGDESRLGNLRDPAIRCIQHQINGGSLDPIGDAVPLSSVRLLPPVRWPSKNVICVGKNYRDHAAEFTGSGYDSSASDESDIIPGDPIIFSKAACCLIGANDDVQVPWSLSNEIDYEAELGLVIGRGGRNISPETAFAHVWGYTVVNDVTARDLQSRHKQWLLGKSIDTFCPAGPWIVSADDLDPEDLELKCWVNGELRQSANTKDLIFDIPRIISAVSASMTLETGDIIATGTPAGVGIGFSPPRFLQKGDVVSVEIGGIGTIANRVT